MYWKTDNVLGMFLKSGLPSPHHGWRTKSHDHTVEDRVEEEHGSWPVNIGDFSMDNGDLMGNKWPKRVSKTT